MTAGWRLVPGLSIGWGPEKLNFVTLGQLPPALERVNAAMLVAFSVPSRVPTEAVAWLRATVDDRVSPEKEQRMSLQGQRSAVVRGPALPFHTMLLFLLGKEEGPWGRHQESESKVACLQQLEASIRHSSSDPDNLRVEKAIR